MAFDLKDLNSLQDLPFDTVIDVRAPAEFAEDHVPGAISMPVLSDEERARVGTIYVQDSAFKARKIGAALVARNAADHIEQKLIEKDGGWQPLVYCWRGGQRSGSFASILEQIGWRVQTLSGGYQSYRRLVVTALYDTAFTAPVVLLDGNTGTAKTDILTRLPALGVQVIDLEGLANHRGSALGGQGEQPSQKAFESRLAAEVSALDPTRPVVIEAESSRVGRVNLPPEIWKAMQSAPRIEISAPFGARVEYLVQAYADVIADRAALRQRIERLLPLQGRARVGDWLEMVEAGRFDELAGELIEHHYDPRYRKARDRHAHDTVRIEASSLESAAIDALATQVAESAKTMGVFERS